MFYVSATRDDDDDVSDEGTDAAAAASAAGERITCPGESEGGVRLPQQQSNKSKSSTLKSSSDFDTPPESPTPPRASSGNGIVEVHDEENANQQQLPPVPPPRTRRKASVKKLENLKLGIIGGGGGSPLISRRNSGEDNKVSSDILMSGYASSIVEGERDMIKGHLSMLVISAKGLRQVMKVRWFVCDKRLGRLRYYRSEDEVDLVGEIDIQSATFCYDVQADKNGEFTVCTRQGDHVLSAGTSERRMYWLQQLQKARREFSHNPGRNAMNCQVGLLRTPTEDANATTETHSSSSGFLMGSKDNSPFKEIMQTLDRPPTADFTSPPRSADYYKKPSFFQSFTRNKAHFRMPRSASMRTPSPPPGMMDQRSPPPSKPASSPSSTSFTALNKIRRSIREKRGGNAATPNWSPKRFAAASASSGVSTDESRELMALRDDLQAAKDEGSASKEVIALLRRQIETLQKEIETLSALQRPGMDDGHLLDILRTKDGQIVDLEAQSKENQKTLDLQENQIVKLKEEIKTYQHLLESKDETIVRLTNQVHEMELTNVMTAATSQDSPGINCGGGGGVNNKLTSNGLSFDSDRFEFKEFVDVCSQTSVGDKERENLQDTVTAYEMQNKFLNKEVLELNQLRQLAGDREQKLFIEASHWEAKFCQIQSKYLFLLNELHNPQVAVSASRKEMVGQLLKDIVEAAERPTLTSASTAYDRFGFRIDLEAAAATTESSSLEDRAERLKKQADDQVEIFSSEFENPESKWEEAISALNGKVPFAITSDIKRLLRQGIPISQRGAVWKAIVDHKLMRSSSSPSFQTDYYQMLLANYNPSRNLTPAAKQIELDLLRTLPNNKHYDSPHADGVAKLRRVLLAYSVHNPDVEYCQGFNRIAAIALLFMNEEDAFWLLVYIIEHLMPPEYYSRDKQLIGAQVDQEVLKELLLEKLPRLGAHFALHQVDAGMFSLNWFLCVFVDNIPVKTYLHIWDAFLFEGSKVLFRYAIAIFKYLEDILVKQTDYMSIINALRSEVEGLSDVRKLTQIAFRDVNPFPMRTINNKREHHYKLLEAQKRELDHIRQNYRKNSLARTPNSGKSVGGVGGATFFVSSDPSGCSGGSPRLLGGGLPATTAGGSDEDDES